MSAQAHKNSENQLDLIHHITDSHSIEIPFSDQVIHLPHLQIGGLDLSITKHLVMMWIVVFLLLVLIPWAVKRRKMIPSGFSTLVEMVLLFIRDEIAIKNMGKEAGRKYLPFLTTIFFFILFCNLLGLIPFMATATGNISVTAALALMAFFMIQFSGIRKHGFANHVKHLIPPGLPFGFVMIPLMAVVETMGVLAKPFALCVRLFANMVAGHVVILSLLGLIFIFKSVLVAPVSVAFALFIYLLEIFVSLLQAYIFTILTALFMGASINPEH